MTFTISDEGQHNVRFHAVDVVGNVEIEQQIAFSIDDTAPVAEDLSVMSGSGLGNCVVPTGTVWLVLSANDIGSGVKQMRLSNDGVSWSTWRAYETQTLWALSSLSSPSSVYLQVQDSVGWLSTPISQTLSYVPPNVWCTHMPSIYR